MRLNKFIAQNSHLSRRQADKAIASGRVTIDSKSALLGQEVNEDSVVTLDNIPIQVQTKTHSTLLINKPEGYVCSRDGQGNPTVYDLIPRKFHNLNIAGRLDKDSSGLVVMSSDGDLLYELTHPSNEKSKEYNVELDKELTESDILSVTDGVDIGDERPSKFISIKPIAYRRYSVVLDEGRNRQIRRTFEKLGFRVKSLHRTKLGQFSITNINTKKYTEI